MKKLNLLALFMVVLVGGFIKCASIGSMDKVSICKRACASNKRSCVEEAKEDTKEVAKCKAKNEACFKGCEESR